MTPCITFVLAASVLQAFVLQSFVLATFALEAFVPEGFVLASFVLADSSSYRLSSQRPATSKYTWLVIDLFFFDEKSFIWFFRSLTFKLLD